MSEGKVTRYAGKRATVSKLFCDGQHKKVGFKSG